MGAAPAPVVEYIAPAPAVVAAPAPVVEYIAPAPAVYAAPAPVVEYIAGTCSGRRTCACRGVHGASTCSLCCTCRDINCWLRFSPCGAHRLQVMTLASCARHDQSSVADVVDSATCPYT